MEIPIPAGDHVERVELLGRILILHGTDGHRTELPLDSLRRHCPCATCGAGKEAEPRSALHVLPPAGSNELVGIHPVGRYALQFRWKDGHDTGIYSFELLRSLCECPDCASG